MSDFSTLLKSTREAQGLSLDEVAQRTYIKRPYLEALESGRAAELPAPVYTYGYIRQYAKLLGLDGGALVARYQLQERTGGEGFASAAASHRSQSPMADLPGEPFNPFKAAFSPNGNGNGHANGHAANGHGHAGANGSLQRPSGPLPGEVAEVSQAQQRAQQILGAAQRDADQLVRGAERYADDVLATLEREIAQTLQTIQNGRQFLASRRSSSPFGP